MTVHQAASDADVLIVTTALFLSTPTQPVAIVSKDTDVLAIATARSTNQQCMYVLMPGGQTPARIYNIRNLQQTLGASMTQALLFIHDATGCDTTSAMFRKGKKSGFDLLKKNSELRSTVSVFNKPDATNAEVTSAGEAFLIMLYTPKNQKKHFDNLDEFRFFAYSQMVGRQKLSASFDLATLPPTSDAGRQHFYRVYHQVCIIYLCFLYYHHNNCLILCFEIYFRSNNGWETTYRRPIGVGSYAASLWHRYLWRHFLRPRSLCT